MLQAASRGHVDTVSMLLRRGANLFHQNQEGESALHLACYHQHMAVCEYLCEEASQRMKPSMKLSETLEETHGHGLTYLLSLTNTQGETCLFYASRRGNIDIVRYLIQVCTMYMYMYIYCMCVSIYIYLYLLF